MSILEHINTPEELKRIPEDSLAQLCQEIRQQIIDDCAENPGHLGSSLGTIELTVALHYVLNTPYDNLIWDWDFAADGTTGWVFEGFSPWPESGNLVAWDDAADDAVFSYTITDVPNGVYTLQNDIKVKNNMLNAQMALSDGTAENEVKTKKITTDDVFLEDQFMSAFGG